MAEVLKISSLEYKKNTGQLDLSHLKRKPKQEETNTTDFTDV